MNVMHRCAYYAHTARCVVHSLRPYPSVLLIASRQLGAYRTYIARNGRIRYEQS